MPRVKQPHGFSVFFLTEMWERYGFYIIQGLLVLYLTQYFNLSDTLSYAILGSFTALAYINPILGGYIADKILGAKKSILGGALLISAGYALLVVSVTNLSTVLVGLGIIAIGTGLLKPNVSSLLGSLYQQNDHRRHAGFTLFYVGINIGNGLSLITGGYLQEYLGWRSTYLIVAFVLLFAFLVFYFGARHYHLKDSVVSNRGRKNYCLALLLIVGMIIANVLILKLQTVATIAFTFVSLVSFVFVLFEALKSDQQVRQKLIAYLLLVILSVFFWAIFFQVFLSMNLFMLRVVDRDVFGFVIPASVFIGVESIGVIVLGPLLSLLWQYLERKNLSPSIPTKFALGLLVVTLAFTLLFFSSLLTNQQGQVLALWVIVVYILIALGELLLSPTGLAMVTELVPKHLSGVLMGIFFVSLGLGGKLAGVIADFAAIPENFDNLAQMEAIYHHAFGIYAMVGAGITLLSLLMIKKIKSLMQ